MDHRGGECPAHDEVVIVSSAMLESGACRNTSVKSSRLCSTSIRSARNSATEVIELGPAIRPDEMTAPDHGLFYGIINDCIEQLVMEKFGRSVWHAVKARAGLHDVEDGDFLKSQQYDQDLTYKIVEAITEVANLTAEEVLDAAGEFFVGNYLVGMGYLDLLRSQGKNLKELMSHVDTLHAHLKRVSLPGLAPPCFRVEDTRNGFGFHLHYWSFRPGLAPLARGMVRACALAIFDEVVDIETVSQEDRNGNHYALFLVTPSDDAIRHRAADQQRSRRNSPETSQPPAGLEKSMSASKITRSISFSAASAWANKRLSITKPMKSLSHSTEVGTLVHMLKNSVCRLETEEDVEHFQNCFSTDQLCKLLDLKGHAAVEAMQALFREPYSTSTTRVPHSGFLAKGISVREYPSVTTHRGVCNRFTHHSGVKRIDPFNAPLADQMPRTGLLGLGAASELKPLRVRACFLQNILQLKVLKSIAHNPNVELFETEECQAIITAAWEKVRCRFVFDVMLDILVLCVMMQWKRTDEHFASGVLVLWMVVVKEMLEECWNVWVHLRHGWLWEYPTAIKLGTWGRSLMMSMFCVMNTSGAASDIQRPVYAVVVLLRWMGLLYTFRAFAFTGPKLLPLMYTFKSMGSFFLVLVFYIAGFIHAFWGLSTRSWFEVFEIVYRLGVMADFSLDENDDGILEGGKQDGWLMAWFFVCSALLTIFMMNVVISVLGESYDVEQERAQFSFLHARAVICTEYLPRLKRSSQPLRLYSILGRVLQMAEQSQLQCCAMLLLTLPVSIIYFLQRVFVCEWHVFDHMGDATKNHSAGFLWYCTAEGEEAHMNVKESRLLNLKHHTQTTVENLRLHMDKSFLALQSSLEALAERVENLVDAQQQDPCSGSGPRPFLPEGGCGSDSQDSAVAPGVQVPPLPGQLESGTGQVSISQTPAPASATGSLGFASGSQFQRARSNPPYMHAACPFSAAAAHRLRPPPIYSDPAATQCPFSAAVRHSKERSHPSAAKQGSSWRSACTQEGDDCESPDNRGTADSAAAALVLLRESISRVESLAESLHLPSCNAI